MIGGGGRCLFDGRRLGVIDLVWRDEGLMVESNVGIEELREVAEVKMLESIVLDGESSF